MAQGLVWVKNLADLPAHVRVRAAAHIAAMQPSAALIRELVFPDGSADDRDGLYLLDPHFGCRVDDESTYLNDGNTQTPGRRYFAAWALTLVGTFYAREFANAHPSNPACEVYSGTLSRALAATFEVVERAVDHKLVRFSHGFTVYGWGDGGRQHTSVSHGTSYPNHNPRPLTDGELCDAVYALRRVRERVLLEARVERVLAAAGPPIRSTT